MPRKSAPVRRQDRRVSWRQNEEIVDARPNIDREPVSSRRAETGEDDEMSCEDAYDQDESEEAGKDAPGDASSEVQGGSISGKESGTGAPGKPQSKPKWKCEVAHSGVEDARAILPHLVQDNEGRPSLLLGGIILSAASARGKLWTSTGDKSTLCDDQMHFRLMKEGDERYCNFSVLEDGEVREWKAIHVGTLEGWGSVKGKGTTKAQEHWQETTLMSLYNLVRQGIVELPVSTEEGQGSFQNVRVSVQLKAIAITETAIPVSTLENLHGGQKYASDLRKIIGWLQPGLVDMGAQVRSCGCVRMLN